jgi:RPA family protein
MPEIRKRETAHKIRIGDLLKGIPVVEEVNQDIPNPSETQSHAIKERFRFLELGDKHIVRVNIIANIIDKYVAEGEKNFLTLTIDDATGQIRIKAFGEEAIKLSNYSQGDTIIVIGVLRSYNRELYINPEIIRKTDPRYLLVRKLELEKGETKIPLIKSSNNAESQIGKTQSLREEILDLIKNSADSSGISTEELILKIKTSSPESINGEIIRLLEEGMLYEPRPGKVRYLG